MSHPERLGASGGGSAGTITQPPPQDGTGVSLADFATSKGLSHSAARPKLGVYISALWQRRHFIWKFATSKSVSMYTESKLGQVWQVLTPMLNAAVYYLVFGVLLGRKGDVSNYISFLVIGVFVFTFTQRSFISGARSVGGNLPLIRALHFPRASLAFADVLVELQQLLTSMAVLVVIMLCLGEYPTWTWFYMVPILALQLLFNIGASLVMARFGAFVPDTSQLLPFLLRTWLYLSGIFFSMWSLATKAPNWAMRILEANPGSVYVELARRALMPSYDKDLKNYSAKYLTQCQAAHPTGPVSAMPKDIKHQYYAWEDACREHSAIVAMNHSVWLYAIGWAIVAFMLGFWFFHRAEERYGRG
jgi:teichoic acid transport system permease protein